MQTRSSSRLTRDQNFNPTSSTNTTPKGHNCRSSKQKVENSNPKEHLHLIVTMVDNRTMVELLRAPTEGYAEAILVPPILTEQFELKHSLINMMTTDQFFGLEKDNPHDDIRWGSPLVSIKRNPPYKDLLRACPHHGFTELHQLDTFYNALNPAYQDSLNAAACGNLLERITQDVLTIIENKSKVRNSRSKPIAFQVKACDTNSNSKIAKLTHAVNQQMSAVTTAMTAMLKQFQATPPPAPVKDVEETCGTCGGAHPYYQYIAAGGNTFPEFRDNIQGYVLAAAVNYNKGNPSYRPQGVANQIRPPGLKCSTSNRGSKPTGNKKNDMISQTSSMNMKNNLEAHPKKVNKKNLVVEPIRELDVKHSLLNVNSICATWNRSQFINFVSKFMGTVRFGNDHITRIMGYVDYQLGNVTISKVYYVEWLGHSLFSAEAINTTCYTQNRSLIRLRYNKTPYELMQDKKPDLSFFHVFGALRYPTNDNDDLVLVVVIPRDVDLADSPVSTSIDQDAPSKKLMNFKQAMTKPSWIDSIQEEIHEFKRLQVWELVPCPDKVILIKLKWIYKVKADEFGGVLKNKARLVAQESRKRRVSILMSHLHRLLE
nr:Gag-Pol polyprotein [Tanacetum cinerariifolium]